MKGRMLDAQHLGSLSRRREEAQRTLEQVKELLLKADERRLQEPSNQRKWNQVLDHLEYSLDEAKARLESVEGELARAQAPLTGDQEKSNAVPPANVAAEQAILLNPEEERLLAAPIEELSKFSLEEISGFHRALKDHPKATSAGRLLGRLELANQMRQDSHVPKDTPHPEQYRRQLTLRAAIDKIQVGRIELMTADEMKLIISCHSLLRRRLNPTPQDERLLRILDSAVDALKKRSEELRQARS